VHVLADDISTGCVFPVKIVRPEMVGGLKDEIKNKKEMKHEFNVLMLIVWISGMCPSSMIEASKRTLGSLNLMIHSRYRPWRGCRKFYWNPLFEGTCTSSCDAFLVHETAFR
jgi:hypothetical protein